MGIQKYVCNFDDTVHQYPCVQLFGVVCCAYCVVVQTSMQFNSIPSPSLSVSSSSASLWSLQSPWQWPGPSPSNPAEGWQSAATPKTSRTPTTLPPTPGWIRLSTSSTSRCHIHVAGYFVGGKFREMLDKAIRTNFHGSNFLRPEHSQAASTSFIAHTRDISMHYFGRACPPCVYPLSTWYHDTWPDLPGLPLHIWILQAIKDRALGPRLHG